MNLIPVDKDQYKGAEASALLNTGIDEMKAYDTDYLNEMSDQNIIGFLVYITIQKTNDDFLQDLISKYCRQVYEKQIIEYLRGISCK